MSTALRQLAAAAVVVAAGAVAVVTVAAQDGRRTVRDGVFSAPQAARGEQLFESICMDCHEIEEFTAAGAYLEEMEGKPLWEIFEYIWAEMPEDNPASLNPRNTPMCLPTCSAFTACRAGDADMPTDRATLEAITFTRPAGS